MSTCETLMVSPEMAANLRKSADFELQRPMSAVNVARLRAEMDANRFVPGTPVYFAVLPDKSMLALNGQHTLEAISRGKGLVELTFIYQDVKTSAEAGAIYARLDLHKIRSWRDSLRAYGAEDMLADSTTWTAAYAAAIGQIFMLFENSARKDRSENLIYLQATRSRDLRVKVMREFQPHADLYVSAVGGLSGRKHFFKRAAIFGVGLEIMRYQPSAGTEFFTDLANDDGLRVGDPARALLRMLRDSSKTGAAAERDLQARAVAVAWNAFFEKRRLEIVKPHTLHEMRLSGTPWGKEDFDPIDAYLPELRKQQEEKPSLRARKIQTGVGAKGESVTIFA